MKAPKLNLSQKSSVTPTGKIWEKDEIPRDRVETI